MRKKDPDMTGLDMQELILRHQVELALEDLEIYLTIYSTYLEEDFQEVQLRDDQAR
jgi:hypothetical protein